MVHITWNANVEIADGPTLKIPGQPLTVDAYDKIETTIPISTSTGNPPKPSTTTVEIQPGDQVEFLLITSSLYSNGDKRLTYTVDEDPDQDKKEIDLDGPQLLAGTGAVDLLPSMPKHLTFTNKLEKPATIQIHVGRKAIPT